MHETPSWQNDVSRNYGAHSVTFDKTTSGVGVGNMTKTAVETISSSASSAGHGRAIAVTVGVVLTVLPVGIVVIAIFKWWVDRRRARAHLREPDIWRCESVEAIHGIGSASHGEASSPVSPNLKRVSLNSRRVSPYPPTLTFPLVWLDRNQSQSETEKYRHYECTSPARFLPVHNLRALSTVSLRTLPYTRELKKGGFLCRQSVRRWGVLGRQRRLRSLIRNRGATQHEYQKSLLYV
ncbi:uncharacterized protein FOMMEDRAFT_18563 [Fomitiporia mediterranea MF3/22]|uniref:uncharacterized protein n=1 Tax=Fomitiporia mediterranea (strain MF3/22) TaxID=694068 RepID=UPI00044082E1|nr:uncharacterized protein FOMMEDRAFT_18563 [Fomitiporia mediterranea MF3/22]EJD04837.1 hypothetical protein FOMMEDRAFT_18563 [Fomitiporia mediterranea MF3/22]